MNFSENRKKEQSIFINEGKDAIKQLFSKKWYHQIPNLLTASRGIAPLVVLPLAITGNMPAVIIAELIFASTDFFDGLIARKFGFYSDFGKKLDTICDKIFAVNLLLPILLFMPTVGINIGLEIVIAIINSISMIKGNNPKSSLLGKLKTASLSLSIIILYLSILTPIASTIITTSLTITTLLQSTAAFDYYIVDKIKDLKKENTDTNYCNTEQKEDNSENEIKKKEEDKEIHYENNFPLEGDFEKRISYTNKKKIN